VDIPTLTAAVRFVLLHVGGDRAGFEKLADDLGIALEDADALVNKPADMGDVHGD